MIYVCPEKDRAVQKPCEPCICGMDKLPAFEKPPGTAVQQRMNLPDEIPF